MIHVVAKYTEDYSIKNYIVYDSSKYKYFYVPLNELEKYKIKRLDSIDEKYLPEINIKDSNRIFSGYNDKKYLHKKFGKLTVDFFCIVLENNMMQFKWMCSCDCTSIPKAYRPDKVANGKYTSCGCQSKYADKEYIGKIYGNLRIVGIDTNKIYYNGEGLGWICECLNCGKRFGATARKVVEGRITSCGEAECKRVFNMSGNIYDNKKYIGKTFGLLKVRNIRYGYIGKSKGIIWDCDCECGGKASFFACNIVKGNNRSCGCLRSFHEKLIRKILTDYKVKYETEVKMPGLLGVNDGNLRFDFKIYLKDSFILLEYQGNQHYENSNYTGTWNLTDLHINDKIKKDYCNKNNIKLIEISGKYDESSMIEKLKKLGIIA